MKRIVSIFMACLVLCSAGGVIASAAVPPDNGGIVSPCYLYTNQVYSNLSINQGAASCRSTVYGIQDTTTMIVVTKILQKKNGNSWTDVNTWNKIFFTWYCSYPSPYTVTEKGTYRVRTVAKVYKGTDYETVYANSTEVTY